MSAIARKTSAPPLPPLSRLLPFSNWKFKVAIVLAKAKKKSSYQSWEWWASISDAGLSQTDATPVSHLLISLSPAQISFSLPPNDSSSGDAAVADRGFPQNLTHLPHLTLDSLAWHLICICFVFVFVFVSFNLIFINFEFPLNLSHLILTWL